MTTTSLIEKRLRDIRRWLGVALLEAPRYRGALARPDRSWIGLANRREATSWSPDKTGVACNWEWTSTLHAPSVMPRFARELMTRALAEFPFRFVPERPAVKREPNVDVTFIIGHRGLDRLPHLLATLQSIAAQEGVNVECIVVEQSTNAELADRLPEWVSYFHTLPPCPNMPYSRSWAFNVGARHAQGRMLIFHDNDLLIPVTYADEHIRFIDAGHDIANLKRYLFYLTKEKTEELLSGRELQKTVDGVEAIMQNALGGGSLAISRRAFLEIGGFDEDFVGWGGEDNEIWDRIMTRDVYPFGHFPLIHLWHAPQQGKGALNGRGVLTAELTDRRRRIPACERIAELRQRRFGDLKYTRYSGP